MAATENTADVMTDIAAIAQQAGKETPVEAATIDILSLFAARMQHHFARGPFSKELRKRLIAADQAELGERAYQYYLAANVLKHGSGSSYHELRKIKGLPFGVKQPDGSGTVKAEGLIDVNSDGFLDELIATLGQAKLCLESA